MFATGSGWDGSGPETLTIEFGHGANAGLLLWTPTGQSTDTAFAAVRTQTISFQSFDGTKLVGRLDLPLTNGRHPGVVIVHGSGTSSAVHRDFHGDLLGANGIATLTFDKRGTGGSGGAVTFDYHILARDVAAAAEALARNGNVAPDAIGLAGFSQGGWVAPLAACLSPTIRFVLVGYGMIESPAEEARFETIGAMQRRGANAADIAAADPLIRAAINVVAENFESGWEELEREKRVYKTARWGHYLQGTTVAALLRYPKWVARLVGPRRAPPGQRWHHNSFRLLQETAIPMTWLLGSADRSAPNEQTIERLRALAADGKPYELVVFPNADHGMIEFVELNGERSYTRLAPQYFSTLTAAIHSMAASSTVARRPDRSEECIDYTTAS